MCFFILGGFFIFFGVGFGFFLSGGFFCVGYDY